MASPKPDTNANGETPIILSKTKTLIEGKVPITKPIKKLHFIFDGKELKSLAKRTRTKEKEEFQAACAIITTRPT